MSSLRFPNVDSKRLYFIDSFIFFQPVMKQIESDIDVFVRLSRSPGKQTYT